jgi:hypothetical protein
VGRARGSAPRGRGDRAPGARGLPARPRGDPGARAVPDARVRRPLHPDRPGLSHRRRLPLL